MNKDLLIKQVTESQLRSDLPNIEVGDSVEVLSKLYDKKNKDKFKLTSFKGTVISCNRKNLISHSFAVLKEANKIIVKKIFFFHSPLIAEIKRIGKLKKVRRAKLFYLERALSDKKSKS